MTLFPLIPWVHTEISFSVPGIEIPLVVPKKEVEAGGMTTAANVLFCQISMVFIRVVDIKPGPIFIGED